MALSKAEKIKKNEIGYEQPVESFVDCFEFEL